MAASAQRPGSSTAHLLNGALRRDSTSENSLSIVPIKRSVEELTADDAKDFARLSENVSAIYRTLHHRYVVLNALPSITADSPDTLRALSRAVKNSIQQLEYKTTRFKITIPMWLDIFTFAKMLLTTAELPKNLNPFKLLFKCIADFLDALKIIPDQKLIIDTVFEGNHFFLLHLNPSQNAGIAAEIKALADDKKLDKTTLQRALQKLDRPFADCKVMAHLQTNGPVATAAPTVSPGRLRMHRKLVSSELGFGDGFVDIELPGASASAPANGKKLNLTSLWETVFTPEDLKSLPACDERTELLGECDENSIFLLFKIKKIPEVLRKKMEQQFPWIAVFKATLLSKFTRKFFTSKEDKVNLVFACMFEHLHTFPLLHQHLDDFTKFITTLEQLELLEKKYLNDFFSLENLDCLPAMVKVLSLLPITYPDDYKEDIMKPFLIKMIHQAASAIALPMDDDAIQALIKAHTKEFMKERKKSLYHALQAAC